MLLFFNSSVMEIYETNKKLKLLDMIYSEISMCAKK